MYAYGRMLVQGGDEQGVAIVEKAMALDADAEQSGAELLFEFYRGRKDLAGMDRWHAKLDQLAGTRARAHAELTRFEPKDPLQPHGVSEPTLAKLVGVIAEQRKVKRAWLVRKHGKHLPKVPGYLLLLEFAWTSHLTGGRDVAVRAVLDRFAVDEDGFVVIRDAAESRRLRRAVAKVAGRGGVRARLSRARPGRRAPAPPPFPLVYPPAPCSPESSRPSAASSESSRVRADSA